MALPVKSNSNSNKLVRLDKLSPNAEISTMSFPAKSKVNSYKLVRLDKLLPNAEISTISFSAKSKFNFTIYNFTAFYISVKQLYRVVTQFNSKAYTGDNVYRVTTIIMNRAVD